MDDNGFYLIVNLTYCAGEPLQARVTIGKYTDADGVDVGFGNSADVGYGTGGGTGAQSRLTKLSLV